MARWTRSYAAYSVACAVVWLVLLGAVVAVDSTNTQHAFFAVAAGWWICWISATIARLVYPPPKRWR